MMSDDLATNVSATIALGRAVTASPVDPELFSFIIATNMVVPVHVRAGMASRETHHIDSTLPKLCVPVRFVHGRADPIILPSSSEAGHRAVRHSVLQLLDGVAHAPHIEASPVVKRAIRDLHAAPYVIRRAMQPEHRFLRNHLL